MSDRQFEFGDYVRLSELGRSRMMRGIERRGRVVGFGRTDSVVRVQFEAIQTPVSLHQKYLELDKRAAIEARMRASNSPSKFQAL
jgi:hypothetical protein